VAVVTEDQIPDLKTLLVGLLRLCAEKWPDMVQAADADRIAKCDDVTLVGARVACAIARRAGVTSEEVAALVAASSGRRADPADMAAFDASATEAEGVPHAQQVMWEVDRALTDPARRSRLPDWFVDQFWPEAVRRVAMGSKPTSREVSVMLAVLEHASGRRG
jgi:hypothetical protein